MPDEKLTRHNPEYFARIGMARDAETFAIKPKDRECHFALFLFEFIAFGIPAIGLFVLLMIGLLLGILAFSKPAHAHSWYDNSCCNERDCYPISADEVEALPNGDWRVKATGDLFSGPHGKSLSHVRFSPDGQFHRCSWNADRKASSICLYVPLPDGS